MPGFNIEAFLDDSGRSPGRMHMRTAVTVLLVALVAASSGCVDNMVELKEALGFKEKPAPLPEPVYDPPVAKAQVNLTRALVGESVRFTSEGSRDPQGLPLSYTWRFGDNETAEGSTVTHAYAAPGDYAVTLVVTNGKGLTDTEVLALTVAPPNRAPVAIFSVRDTKNATIASAETDARLRFDANASYDLDNDPLSYLWTFGDGATSIEPAPTHAYAKPGLYTARLKLDDGTLTNEASRILAINGSLRVNASFTPTDGAPRTHTLHVAEYAQLLTVTVTFDSALGANDVRLKVLDAQGTEVAASEVPVPAGTQGITTRNVTLTGDILAQHAPGDWTFELTRAKGVQVDYQLVARETF